MSILKEKNEFTFSVSQEFSSHFLIPIIENLRDKAEHQWDDYNEVYHCSRFIESVRKHDAMQMDFHSLTRAEEHLGIVLVTTGIIDQAIFFGDAFPADESLDQAAILNYFHIAPSGRGNGAIWLKEVLIPYYKEKGCRFIYLKSSHPKAFPLYRRLGEEIGAYESISDNQHYKRTGKLFKITL